MPSIIKRLREARFLTLADVAKKTGLAEVDLKRLERKWDEPSPAVVRDLAIVLNCNVHDLTGQKAEPEQRDRWPYSIVPVEEEEFGGVYLEIAGKSLAYALSEMQKETLLLQIQGMELTQNDHSGWLSATTLCGRLLFINPSAVRTLSLKHDDETETPYYVHPEVYRGLYQYDDPIERGPVLSAAMDQVIQCCGDAAFEDQRRAKYLFLDGTEEHRYLHDGDVATALFSMDLNSTAIVPDSLILVEREGGYVNSWINLSHVAMIDVPWEQYLRLTAPE